jgi:hypothetical protein
VVLGLSVAPISWFARSGLLRPAFCLDDLLFLENDVIIGGGLLSSFGVEIDVMSAFLSVSIGGVLWL